MKKQLQTIFSFVLIGVLLCSCTKKDSENSELLGQICGTIKTTINQGIDSAVVTINTSPIQSKTTGIDGKYEFNDLKPGNYLISVSRKSYQNKSQTINLIDGNKQTLDFIFPSMNDRIAKKWIFSVKPQENWNNYQGHLENRTVFDGSEELEFNNSGIFYINKQNYGNWILKTDQWVLYSSNSIYIDMTSTNGYAAYGFNQNIMTFEILLISDSTMLINHPYYKYTDNRYNFKVKTE